MAKVLPTNNLIEFEGREELAPQMNSACMWRMVCSGGPYHTDGDSFASLTCRSHPVGPGRVPNMRRLKSAGTLDLPMTAPKSTDEERTRAGWTEIASVITS